MATNSIHNLEEIEGRINNLLSENSNLRKDIKH